MARDGFGLVSEIQGFSIHDGPGIRTTVFLKGCPLNCLWCHSPETIRPAVDILVHESKCLRCGVCTTSCSHAAHSIQEGSRVFRRDVCVRCGTCVTNCLSSALGKSGYVMSVEEVMGEVLKDKPFFETSGGGVTFSGGEPLLQANYLSLLLAGCQEAGIETAVDTSGSVPWASFDLVHPHSSLFLYDLKLMDGERHRKYTGADNFRILENLKRLDRLKKRIIIRIPVIPGINDDETNIRASAEFLAGLGNVETVELLTFNTLGAAKYGALGLEYPLAGTRALDKGRMEELRLLFERKSVPACVV
jgi:pyruvate formate lyase activating enzyme